MNAARIRQLVTAGFIAAALLVAVPAQSEALTPAPARSSAGSSPAGATDTASAVGATAAAYAQTASLPAVSPGEVTAALSMLSECGCPPNAGEVKYALKELGVKP